MPNYCHLHTLSFCSTNARFWNYFTFGYIMLGYIMLG